MTRYDDATGRYLYLTVDNLEYRVYVEEAGSGPALLVQHTAGSDSRQWRHLLADRSVTSRFRVVAYDLPQHGKSLPALSSRWWEEDYRLTTDHFMNLVIGIADALGLDVNTTYMGCSMGGHLAGDLALHYPDRFRAVVGIEAGIATHGSAESLVHMYHPRVTNEFKAAVMYSLTAPTSPEDGRREATWGYLQSAPGTHRGDLHYYIHEHDLSETASHIDTSRVSVYLMSGEYDWSSTPENTRQLANQISGSKLVEMKGIGHFPMVENYPLFRRYLEPILHELSQRQES